MWPGIARSCWHDEIAACCAILCEKGEKGVLALLGGLLPLGGSVCGVFACGGGCGGVCGGVCVRVCVHVCVHGSVVG